MRGMVLSRVTPVRSLTVPAWLLPVLVLAGALLGGAAVYARTSGYGVPRTETGTVTMVNVDGASMGFQRDRPDCLRVGSHVELSIVNIRNGNVHGEDVVTDVRCLG
jgi:hypothetical protein